MSIGSRVYRRLSGMGKRAVSSWRLYRFKMLEGMCHSGISIGNATVFHVPVRSGGRGTVIIGDKNSFGFWGAPRLGSGEILLQPRHCNARIVIGNENAFSNNVSLIAMTEISIGNRCLIGDQVSILDSDFHEISPSSRHSGPGQSAAVKVGNNVWLGARAMILKGVSIGDNTVVGAMSLVTTSLPANCLAAGNPARMIRIIDAESVALFQEATQTFQSI
jgi:maltose O-acetyltransferase